MISRRIAPYPSHSTPFATQPTNRSPVDDEWGDEDVEKPLFPVNSVRVGQPTVQRPLVAPKKPLPPSLMSLPLSKPSILPPPAQKPSSTSSRNSSTNIVSPTVQKPLKAPPSMNNDKDLILDHRSPTSTLPSVLFVGTEEHPVIETEKSPIPTDTVCPVVGESPLNQTIVEKKQLLWGSPPEEAKLSELARNRKNGSSVGGSAVKSIKESDLEDSVFLEQENTHSAARRLSVLPDQQHPSPMASPNRDSTSSVNNHLIHASQASLPTDEEDGWEEPEVEVSKTKTENPKTDVADQKAEMSESDQKKMTEVLREALNAMNEKKKKKEGLKERLREHYKSLTSSRADSVSSVQNEKVDVVTPAEVVDDVSTKSNCPIVSDASERVFMEKPVDEVSSVPEALKQLADAFLTSIADAAYNKNRQAFISEVYALELIALKSPETMSSNSGGKKLDEAKILEKSFD